MTVSNGDTNQRGGNDVAFWVFAYGSLMWRPDFPYRDVVRARLDGFSRSFCVYSIHHRGSPQRPGLVLGLSRGGNCEGLAYRVAAADGDQVLACLRAREQIYGVYREALRPVIFQDGTGRSATALAFIAERTHPQYAGSLPLQLQARIILGACGCSGANLDYMLSTATHMTGLGICDRNMDRLLALVGPHLTKGGPAAEQLCRASALAMAWRRTPSPVRRISRGASMRFVYRRALG